MLVSGDVNILFGLVGGLGLFLFGMRTMSDGLQKVAGDRMRKILAALTNNRLMGTLVGLAVTAIIQSSSATTVMVVGFVNAGLLSLVQAVGVVLGANIGTTVTAQLIAFKVTRFALPAIGLGAAIALFSRERSRSYWGEIILGLGLLFFGLAIMKQAFDPLKHSEDIRQIFALASDYHLLGVLAGALLTVIVQSSTATIGITIALATSGLVSFEGSVALILGENIGTTLTANFAAIGTNLAARRAAFCHFLFNGIGVAYMLVLFPLLLKLVTLVTPGDADMVIKTQAQANFYGGLIGDKPFIARYIANAHTLFNLVNTLIFLPFIGLLARVATLSISGQDDVVKLQTRFIDDRVLNTPPIALGQARRETLRMGRIVLETLQQVNQFLESGESRNLREMERKEVLVDFLQKEITDFLVALSQKSVSAQTSKEISTLMNYVNDFERIGDHCETLWRLAQRKIENNVTFSEVGMNELAEISGKTEEFLAFVVDALEASDRSIGATAISYEDSIDDLEKTLRNNHIERLNTGECAVRPGMIYIDMLHSFEKIGDHTYNVAEALVGDD